MNSILVPTAVAPVPFLSLSAPVVARFSHLWNSPLLSLLLEHSLGHKKSVCQVWPGHLAACKEHTHITHRHIDFVYY